MTVNAMEITKREILFSTIIVLVLLCGGFLIHAAINTSLLDKYQEYDTALQIDNDSELFRYGMRTDVGRAFVYGKVEALDPVTYPEIGGEYSDIKKIKERYTMHTRVVTYTDSKGHTHTRTETYWTWDEVGREAIHSDRISFLNVEFDYGMIDFQNDSYIDTIKESSDVRYQYYGTPVFCEGTIYTTLCDGTITKTDLHQGNTIDETIKSLESKWQIVLFWILWGLLLVGSVVGFCYFKNRWLEDK